MIFEFQKKIFKKLFFCIIFDKKICALIWTQKNKNIKAFIESFFKLFKPKTFYTVPFLKFPTYLTKILNSNQITILHFLIYPQQK